jgi:RNA polymerase sigma-70 factor (ECF subfamily)
MPDDVAGGDERESLARIRAGDVREFERVYRAHHDELVVFAISITGIAEVAHELVNEVFLNIWTSRDTWVPERIRTYLFGAVRNRARNYLRDAQVERTRMLEFGREVVVSDASAPDAADLLVEQAERAEQLWAVVDTLSKHSQIVLTLRWRHQMGFDEIARVLGVSVNAVHTQHSRALAILRTRLKDVLV